MAYSLSWLFYLHILQLNLIISKNVASLSQCESNNIHCISFTVIILLKTVNITLEKQNMF